MSSPHPAQPPLSASYKQYSNPATHKPDETSASPSTSDPTAETRTPHGLQSPNSSDGGIDPTPSALAYGARDDKGDRGDEISPTPASTTEGEQLATYGEAEVSHAQKNKSGFGEQEDLAADLERKKEEQEKIKEERTRQGKIGKGGGDGRWGGVDVEGAVRGEGRGFVGAGE